jgi:hypothetical protein
MSLQPEAIAFHTAPNRTSSYVFSANVAPQGIGALSNTAGGIGFPATTSADQAESFGAGTPIQTFQISEPGTFAVTLTLDAAVFAGGVLSSLQFQVYGTGPVGAPEATPWTTLTSQQFCNAQQVSYTYIVTLTKPSYTYTVNLGLIVKLGETITTTLAKKLSVQILPVA